MSLHTQAEWLKMFRNKAGFGAVIIEGQEVHAACAALDEAQAEIDALKVKLIRAISAIRNGDSVLNAFQMEILDEIEQEKE